MTEAIQTLVPRRADGEALELAMQRIELAGRLGPLGARLWVRHRFRCAEERPVEAVYTFALPRHGAVRRFRIEGEGFSVRSQLEPVEHALRRYEDALEDGHLAAVAEGRRDGLVTLALGNLRPGEAVTVALELVAGTDLEDRRVRFRFPFTLAPAYHRRMRAVRTGERSGEIELPEDGFGGLILPPWREDAERLHRVGFSLAVVAPVPVEEVASPSHPVRVRTAEDGRVLVELATEGDLPNRDLVLDLHLERPVEGVMWGATPDGARHFAAIVPSARLGQAGPGRRRVVFVLDRSGSMEGAGMEAARRAVLACLDALEPEDEVGVVAFGSRVERLTRTLRRATDAARARIRRAVEGIEAGGGTELLAGIEAGAELLGPEGGDLVVITDGQVFGTEEIVAGLVGLGVRVSCLGIGAASQDRFLAHVAEATGGVSRFLTARERVEEEALDLFRRIGRTVARDLAVRVVGADGASLGPVPEKAALEGFPVVVWGELPPGETGGSLRLSWEGREGPAGLDLPLEPPAGEPGATVALLRGARLAAALESAAPAIEGKTRGELEALARRFGLGNRAMALVAVHERADARPGELPATRVVPVGLPEDVQMEAYFARVECKWALPEGTGPGPDEPPVSPSNVAMVRGLLLEPESVEQQPVRSRGRRRGPERRARAAAGSPEDLELVAPVIAARLEADGGLPGRTLGARVAATVAAAVALAWFAQETGTARWRGCLERMLRFLRGVDGARLAPERAALLEEVLEALEAGYVPAGPWAELGRLAVGKRRRSWIGEVWEALEEAFA